MDESILSDFFLNFYTARERSFRLLIGREGCQSRYLAGSVSQQGRRFPEGGGRRGCGRMGEG